MTDPIDDDDNLEDNEDEPVQPVPLPGDETPDDAPEGDGRVEDSEPVRPRP